MKLAHTTRVPARRLWARAARGAERVVRSLVAPSRDVPPLPVVRRLEAHALHAFAWLAVHTQPPLRALAATRMVARLASRLPDAESARVVAEHLAGFGSCLTRALAVGTRLRGAEIVIGAAPPGGKRWTAHAWVEWGGAPVGAGERAEGVMARVRG